MNTDSIKLYSLIACPDKKIKAPTPLWGKDLNIIILKINAFYIPEVWFDSLSQPYNL